MSDLKKNVEKTHVETLIHKAACAESPDSAMKFSQAAINSANAMCALATAEKNQSN